MTHHFDKEQVIARKKHQCEWCLKPINKGAKYFKQSAVDNGDWWTFIAHRLCYYISIEANSGSDEYHDLIDFGFDKEDIKDLVKSVKINLKRQEKYNKSGYKDYLDNLDKFLKLIKDKND